MMGRCRTCKNWRRNSGTYYNPNYGECVGNFVYENDYWSASLPILDGVGSSSPGQYQREFKTGALFGCIHHDPLPEGETK